MPFLFLLYVEYSIYDVNQIVDPSHSLAGLTTKVPRSIRHEAGITYLSDLIGYLESVLFLLPAVM